MTLKELRESRSYTQREVANTVDVSLVTIGAWEAGKAKPLPKHIRALAEFFKVSIAEIRAALDESAAQTKDSED